LLFLFVASITGENAFVRLHLIPVLLGAFVPIIGVVQGGANIGDAIGVSKWFTIEGAHRGLALKSSRFT
jgi:flavin-dependent dehydrogenase